MAQGNPYARFVEVMKRQGRAMNEPAMTVGIVTGVDPVSISVDGVPIAEHIYCYQVTSSNKDEELAAILEQEEYVSPALKGFLKELYEGIRVQPGDYVLVQRVGNQFLICGKVAALGVFSRLHRTCRNWRSVLRRSCRCSGNWHTTMKITA